MLLAAYFSLIAISVLVALNDWRRGMFMLIIVGALQDPVRKLVPGTPGYLVLATAPVWIAVGVSVFKRWPVYWGDFSKIHFTLSRLIIFFVISLIPAAIVIIVHSPGSWMIGLLGAFSYGSLIVAWFTGYAFAITGPRLIPKILSFYGVVTAIMLIGTPLEYLNIDIGLNILGGDIIGHHWYRQIPGVLIEMIAGVYRSPDVMGWHAAMAAMVAVTMATYRKGGNRLFWSLVAGFAVAAAILCGRRKMVLMLPVFAVALVWLHWYARSHGRTATVMGLLLGVVGAGYLTYEYVGRNPGIEEYYFHEIGGVAERLQQHGVNAVVTTYRQSGFFGEGLGSATLGKQHLPVSGPRTWQEGGLGRIMVELGVLGFVAFTLLAISLLISVIKTTIRRLGPNQMYFSIYVGITSIFIANAGSFVVSHQVFGDPFIIIWLSFLLGILLASPRLTGLVTPNRTPSYSGQSSRATPPKIKSPVPG